MSTLVEMLAPAFALSALAGIGLMLLPNAPPRVRFVLAIAGLCAWLVPWPWIGIPIPHSYTLPPLRASLDGIASFGGTLSTAEALVPDAVIRIAPAALPTGAVVTASVFLIGLALFAGDWLALRRCLRRWRAASRPGDALRERLPAQLRDTAAEIRIVRGSAAAAASGWLRPTVWIGDRYTGQALELVLLHEIWHARRRDPVWLTLIAAARRAYWWNPLVAYLARQAVLMLESACDHRCAAGLGKSSYIAQLAALTLGDALPQPRLLATARSANLNVQRLRLLGANLRLRVRDYALIATLSAAGATTAAGNVVKVVDGAAREVAGAAAGVERAMRGADSSRVAIPRTPAGRALETLLDAVNGGDTELVREILSAYTPQELPLPLPSGGRELGVVDVLRSEPLRIEYVVEDPDRGLRWIGELAVAGTVAQELTSSGLRELP